MAVTIDPRPTYFGDRMIVTGSYGAGDTSIDLSGLLASIDFAGVNPSAAQANVQLSNTGTHANDTIALVDNCTVSGTTITVHSAIVEVDPDGAGTGGAATPGATLAGTFLAIGRRS
tara:strand:+ start:210 stop:557 length:348 start_codon:yes stop_codon:yes gene_type:complete